MTIMGMDMGIMAMGTNPTVRLACARHDDETAGSNHP